MRTLIAVLAAALLAGPAGAAGKTAPAAAEAPQASTAPVALSTEAARALLATLSASTKALSADDIISGVEAADAAMTAIHASYTQTLKIPGYGVDQKGSGELWFQKEKKLRIEQTLPRKQTVASDGTTIRIYSPETNQVLEQDWSAFEKSQVASRGLMQFGDYERLREHYRVELLSVESAHGSQFLYKLSLTPREVRDIPYKLELTVSPPDFLPRATRLTLNDTEVTTELAHVEVDPALDPKLFKLETPEGATVIRPNLAR